MTIYVHGVKENPRLSTGASAFHALNVASKRPGASYWVSASAGKLAVTYKWWHERQLYLCSIHKPASMNIV